MTFVCDVMLGRLARYLRMLGLDAPYMRQGESLQSTTEGRPHIFFTKSTVKAGRPGTVLLYNNGPREQLAEIKKYIEPFINPAEMMTRCIECNVPLVNVKKEEIEPFVPEYVYHHHNEFKTCASCRRVYWEGSHASEMHVWVKDFLKVRSKA